MKSAISPDIWETKRMLITKLYKDEEWPLKQVIKLVQTRDFHPSESQLRSRLKKWHITKPSRKKYDGSRRLSGAKKNQSANLSAQKRPSDSSAYPPIPSASTYHTLHSQRKIDESDSFSEGSRPSVSAHAVPEMSISPANRYILPSSPHDDANPFTTSMYSNSILAPSTPITPAVYGMDEHTHMNMNKRTSDATSNTIYFYPPESTSPHSFPATVPVSASYTHAFAPYSDPSPLGLVPEHPHEDYMSSASYGIHPYLANQSSHGHSHSHKNNHNQFGVPLSDLPPPLLDGSAWVHHYHPGHQPPSPHSHSHSHSHSHPFYPDDVGVGIAPPIFQAGHVV
ncbi:Clr5 domain-containing protein [Aspergillus mulundensis]|uniref:Clr5 domain-containing protein n=1 Tax=Aspergillus mulundensis TaxID=1810919 RepID=A0A3D8RSE8_9EURO|nr:Uncharacterized protein DSM5745_06868 [Aspergillus mulundensis]RDW76876.1 Uncharacterized protein DSM5745_06868 [Aspergillus mulundensis]